MNENNNTIITNGIIESEIYKYDSSDDKYALEDIDPIKYFELINFNNVFFAREIVTGAIFPTFFIDNNNNLYTSLSKIKYFDIDSDTYHVLLKSETIELSNEEKHRYIQTIKNTKQKKVLKKIKSFRSANITNKPPFIYLEQEIQSNLRENMYKNRKEKIVLDNSNIVNDSENIDKRINNYKQDFTLKPEHKYAPRINISRIAKYGYDLSTQSNLCNAIGREEEIKQLIKATCIKNKSVILVGESGCGKTAIVEKMAKDVNENSWLRDKTIFYLNTSSVLAGARYRGVFEDNLNEIINFCIHNKGKIILFIDEMHTLYGLGRGEESSMDAMQILKPYIQSGEIIIIGATTKDEYNEYIMNDPAFCRRFDIIEVPVPDRNLNYQILESFIGELKEKYNISLDIDEVQINNIINYILKITDPMCQKAIDDVKVQNPTLAKNVIEDAFTEAKYNNSEVVTINDIYYAIINCNRISSLSRKEAANLLKENVINSEEKEKIIPFSKTKILV